MATHSSILAWKIPWTEEPGQLQSTGSHLLMSVKVDTEKAGLELNIQKTEIMASGPITSWQIDGGKVETVADFIFSGSKNHRSR